MAADVLTASDMESNLFLLPTSVPGGGGWLALGFCCGIEGISLPVMYLTFSEAPGCDANGPEPVTDLVIKE